jgi:hypothetical protein
MRKQISGSAPKVGANVQINNQMTKPLARHFFADVNKLFAL